ncbi:unnamed protein product [Aphanomyces euteiches]
MFERFRKDNIVMPVPEGECAPARVNKVSGYSIDLHAVKNWPVPEKLQHTLVYYGVQVTFFHSLTKRFFGNTWLSPELKPDDCKADVLIEISVAFISDVVDPNCVAVVELVAFEKDRASLLTRAAHGCGWCIMPMFGQKLAGNVGSTLTVAVFQGSPRNLWVVAPKDWQTQDKVPGCKLLYYVRQYDPLAKVSSLLRKNELVSSRDRIPGLRADNLVGVANSNSVLNLPKEIATAEEFTLTVKPFQAFVHLREELEANLIERLTKTRKVMYKEVQSLNGEVATRVLKLALHNGRCFRTRQHTVPLKCDHGSNTLIAVADSPVKLKGYTLSPLFAVVVLLQYTVHFRLVWPKNAKPKSEKEPLPTEDVVVVTIGARALIPSDGMKFYYHDKSSRKGEENTSDSDRINVELLSGTKARPYSDNVIYTPPVWQNPVKAGILEDSFASCDLELLVEGASLPSSDEEGDETKEAPKGNNDNTAERDKWMRELYEKAQRDAALAQALQSPLRPPSPVKSKGHPLPPRRSLEFEEALTTVISDDPTPSHQLSRASKSLLTRHGFYDNVSSEPDARHHHESVVAKSVADELKDRLNLLEIQIQFAALRTLETTQVPASVYFTFQFYTFAPTRTERLFVTSTGSPALYLLCRDHAKKPSLAIHFDVHTTKCCPLEPMEFATYLLTKSLLVDVWDGDSLLPIGSLSIPLHDLLRQGLRVKKCHAEYDLHDRESNQTIGAIQVLLANLASTSTPFPNPIVLPHQDSSVGNWRFAKGPHDDQNSLPPQGPRHRVRAKPLADTNEELRQLLIRERFLEDDTSSSKTRTRRVVSRGQSDGTSITKDEIDRLCKRFETTSTRTNRLDAQALLALLTTRATQPSSKSSGFILANDLHCAILDAIAHGIDLAKAFQELDNDNDGLITSTEFTQRLREFGPKFQACQPESIRACIAAFDVKHDGRVNHVEFMAFLTKHLHLRLRQELRAVFTRAVEQGVDVAAIFRQLDTSRDGQLTCREFESALARLGFQVQDRRAFEEFCRSLDDDGNGTISYLEFIKYMGLESSAQDSVLETLQAVLKRTVANGVDIGELFQHMDADASGTISYPEFMKVIKDLDLDGQLSPAMLQELVLRIDNDKSGTIDIMEFLQFAKVPFDPIRMVQRRLGRVLTRAADQGVSVHDAFAQFDSDGSGNLSAFEFDQALRVLKCPIPEVHLKLVLAKCDVNGDGNVSYKEFLEFCVGKKNQEAILAKPIQVQLATLFREAQAKGIDLGGCFQHFDKDGSREISADEFVKALKELGFKDTTDETIQALVRVLDKDKDGRINYDEFLSLATPRTRAEQAAISPTKKLLAMLQKAIEDGIDVEQAFAHFDKSNSGMVSYEDFSKSLREFGTTQWTKSDMNQIFADLDKDASGNVSLREFQTFLNISLASRFRALLRKAIAEGVPLEDSFKHFTENKDKGIDRSAFAIGMAKLPFNNVTEQEVDALFRSINKSQSGSISLDELGAFVDTEVKAPMATLKALLRRAQDQGVDIDKAFKHFDKDGNGSISYDEFNQAMKELKFDSLTAQDLKTIRQALDRDQSGSISLEEFRSLYDGKVATSNASQHMQKLKDLLSKAAEQGINITDAFAQFDSNGDGIISYDEFDATMAKLGFNTLSSEDLAAIRADLDKEKTGSLSLDNFKALYSAPTKSTAPSKPNAPARQKLWLAKKGSKTDQNAVIVSPIDRLREFLVKAQASGVDIDQAFAHFDKDGDGNIAYDEFDKALNELKIGDFNVADLEQLRTALDQDKSGSISLLEFKKIYAVGQMPVSEAAKSARASSSDEKKTKKPPLAKQRSKPPAMPAKKRETPMEKLAGLLQRAKEAKIDVDQAFAHFDKDGNGAISYDEFESAIKDLNLDSLTNAEIRDIERRLDKDQSGSISLNEFKMLYDPQQVEKQLKSGESSEAPKLEEVVVQTNRTPEVHNTQLCVENAENVQSTVVNASSSDNTITPELEHTPDITNKTERADTAENPTKNDKKIQGVETTQVEAKPTQEIHEMAKDVDTTSAKAINEQSKTKTNDDTVNTTLEKPVSEPPTEKIDEQKLSEDKSSDEVSPHHGEMTQSKTAITKLHDYLVQAKSKGTDIDSTLAPFNDSGVLSYTDFDSLLLEINADALTEQDISDIRHALDINKNGTISLAELKKLLLSPPNVMEANSKEGDTPETPKEIDKQEPVAKKPQLSRKPSSKASKASDSEGEIKDLWADSDKESKTVLSDQSANDDALKMSATNPKTKSGGESDSEIKDLWAESDKESKDKTASGGNVSSNETKEPLEQSSKIEKSIRASAPKVTKPWLAMKGTKTQQISANDTPKEEKAVLQKLRDAFQKKKETGSDFDTAFPPTSEQATISAEALVAGLRALNFELPDSEMAEIGKLLEDKDGGISRVELKSLYEGTAPLVESQKQTPSITTESKPGAGKKPSLVKRPSQPISQRVAPRVALNKLRTVLQQAKDSGVDIENILAQVDGDGDGKVSVDEFKKALEALGVTSLKEAEITAVFSTLDKEKSGIISLTEIHTLYSESEAGQKEARHHQSSSPGGDAEAMTETKPKPNEPVVVDSANVLNTLRDLLGRAQAKGVDVYQAFAHFDANGDGAVSYVEFEAGLKELNLSQFKAPEVTALCESLDKDANGTISLDEFRKLYQKVPPLRNIPSSLSATKGDTPTADKSSKTSQVQTQSKVQKPESDSDTNRVRESRRTSESARQVVQEEYRFSTEPEVRVLELKLRKAAIAALARGVPAGVLLEKYTQKGTGEVLRVDFVQFIMELGLSVIDDLDSAGYVCDAPVMHDKVYARQLERLRQYRLRHRNTNQAQRELIHAASMTNRAIPKHGQAQVDAFVAQKNKMLQVVQYYRDGHKKSLINALLRDHVTTTIHLYPRFGTMLFFEVPVRNPYGHAERFRIEWHDPELLLVTSSEEWQYYRDYVPMCINVAEGNAGAVEVDMIDEMHELLLEGGDSVMLPFRLLTLQLAKQSRTVPVYFKSVAHGHVISVLQVHIQPQPFVCHRTYRYFHAANAILRRCLKFVQDSHDQMDHPNQTRPTRDKFVACPDPSVIVETKAVEHKHMPQEIFVKYRVGEYPSTGEFYLLLYEDMYHARLFEIWRICVQAMLRLDLQASMGQGVRNELIIKGDTMPRRVRCYSSQPHEVQFNPDRIFQLLPHAFNRIELLFCSMEIRIKQIVVNLVDVDSYELVGSWLLNTTTTEPVVTKVFDVTLPLGVPVLKKISYRNPWDDDRLFILRSSDPSIMKPRERKLLLPGYGDGFLRLAFAPHSIACSKKVYLFINDGSDQNEECLLLHVMWSDQRDV